MKENKIIFMLPDINGKMHMINEKNIERLIKSKGGSDVIIYREDGHYVVTNLAVGTID